MKKTKQKGHIRYANVSVVSGEGNPGHIQGIIALKTDPNTWGKLTDDITRNATNHKTYHLNPIENPTKTTLIPGLTRAIPWRYVDPSPTDQLIQAITSIGETIKSALQTAFNTLVNTTATTLKSAVDVAVGIATEIAEGVRMLAAGLMAVADFVVKLFRDAALLLWELGQKIIGTLRDLVNQIADAFKNVLSAVSWFLVQIVGVVMLCLGKILESVVGNLGLDIDYSMEHLHIYPTYERATNIFLNLQIRLDIVWVYVDMFDLSLPFLNVSIIMAVEELYLMISQLAPILVESYRASVSSPSIEVKNETELAGNIRDAFWNSFMSSFFDGLGHVALVLSGINLLRTRPIASMVIISFAFYAYMNKIGEALRDLIVVGLSPVVNSRKVGELWGSGIASLSIMAIVLFLLITGRPVIPKKWINKNRKVLYNLMNAVVLMIGKTISPILERVGGIEQIFLSAAVSSVIGLLIALLNFQGLRVDVRKEARIYLTMSILLWLALAIAKIKAGYIALQKMDDTPPEIIVEEPKAHTRYTAINNDITMRIKATISDDRAIRRISVTLWGTTKTGTFEQTGTLYSVEFDQPNTKTVHINETVNAGIEDIFVLPDHYYVRFVVEDFIGNKRIIWIKIYVAAGNTHEASNRLKHHDPLQVWLGDSTPAFLYICRVRVEV